MTSIARVPQAADLVGCLAVTSGSGAWHVRRSVLIDGFARLRLDVRWLSGGDPHRGLRPGRRPTRRGLRHRPPDRMSCWPETFDATPDAASIRFLRGRQSLRGTSVHFIDAWVYAHPDEPDSRTRRAIRSAVRHCGSTPASCSSTSRSTAAGQATTSDSSPTSSPSRSPAVPTPLASKVGSRVIGRRRHGGAPA